MFSDLKEMDRKDHKVGIFLMPLLQGISRSEDWISFLSEEQKKNFRLLRNPIRRDEYLQGRLLETLVFDYLIGKNKWEIRKTLSGKPRVFNSEKKEENCFFNLSHSAGVFAFAFTKSGAVGVDLEKKGRKVLSLALARRYFHSEEVRWLEGLPAEKRGDAFLSLFTLKESWAKCSGTGIAHHLKDSVLKALEGERVYFLGNWFYHTKIKDLIVACTVQTEQEHPPKIFVKVVDFKRMIHRLKKLDFYSS